MSNNINITIDSQTLRKYFDFLNYYSDYHSSENKSDLTDEELLNLNSKIISFGINQLYTTTFK
jgi:hypothetical protein